MSEIIQVPLHVPEEHHVAGPLGKRGQIMAAASDLFMSAGYGATSMDAIARVSGVSKATLYAYFTSKDELFAEIVTTECQARWHFEAALPQRADARETLTVFAGLLLRFFLRPKTQATFRMVISESPRSPELGRAFYQAGPQAGIEWFSGILRGLAERGLLDIPDPLVAADQFGAMLRGTLFWRALMGQEEIGEEVIDRAVANTVETFMRAFAPRVPAQNE